MKAMKYFLNLSLLFLMLSLTAQQNIYNAGGGYVADGYDMVAYFEGQPEKGSSKFTAEHDGVNYKFATQQHLDTFRQNPEKYVPQYGGWCAYTMGKSGEKVSIDPKTFEIREGKLFLFYNAFFTNTLEKWQEEGPEQLRAKADENWKKAQQGQ